MSLISPETRENSRVPRAVWQPLLEEVKEIRHYRKVTLSGEFSSRPNSSVVHRLNDSFFYLFASMNYDLRT
jgi:hypothetical protein